MDLRYGAKLIERKTMSRLKTIVALNLCLAVALYCGAARAETILFFAAAGVKAPAEVIIKQFEADTGHRVQRVYDTAGTAEAQFLAAQKRGVLITTEPRLLQSAELKGGVMQRVGDTVAGVAISKNFAAKHPDLKIATSADLKHALLTANSIAYSDPARGATVGVHFIKIIDSLGIKEAVLAKAKTPKTA